MSGLTVLITGGAGFIGSHVCVELLEAGYDIVVVDNFSNSCPEALKRVMEITHRDVPYYEIDVLDADKLNDVFAAHRFEAVIHCAGLKAVGESVEFPMKYYRSNLTGTINLCEIMNLHEVHRLVFSSSATVYGAPKHVPITENSPLGATNPYGRTKQMTEQMLLDLHHSDPRWHISILRYFNPIGAHKSGRIGEDPRGVPNNLLPYMTQVAVGKRVQLNIFGNDYPTADGTGVRDYIHVVDLARGHVCALEKGFSHGGAGIYNLGTGRGYSVLEMVDAFEKVSGQKIHYAFVERRPGDIAECYADPAKARRELSWVAVRGIEEMCEDAWRWQMMNPNGYDDGSNGLGASSTNEVKPAVAANA